MMLGRITSQHNLICRLPTWVPVFRDLVEGEALAISGIVQSLALVVAVVLVEDILISS
jgi:hypothetical protein